MSRAEEIREEVTAALTALGLHLLAERIERLEATFMAAADDLSAGITAVQDAVTALGTAVSNIPTGNDAALEQAVETAATQLQAIATSINTIVAQIPAPAPVAPVTPITPAPAPAPAPAPTDFKEKLDGETYGQYVARAQAAGLTPISETDWDNLPVSA